MMLDIMERFVVGEGYSYVRMDGGTPVATRQPLVRRYNEVGVLVCMVPIVCACLFLTVTVKKDA